MRLLILYVWVRKIMYLRCNVVESIRKGIFLVLGNGIMMIMRSLRVVVFNEINVSVVVWLLLVLMRVF